VYADGASVPVWVARKCHNLGNGQLAVNGLGGNSEARENDVIISLEEFGTVVHFDREIFEDRYEFLEE